MSSALVVERFLKEEDRLEPLEAVPEGGVLPLSNDGKVQIYHGSSLFNDSRFPAYIYKINGAGIYEQMCLVRPGNQQSIYVNEEEFLITHKDLPPWERLALRLRDRRGN